MIPTIEQVMKCYRIVASAERMKTGRPGETTVYNVITGTVSVCQAANLPLDSSVDKISRKTFDNALSTFVNRGVTRLTAWSYVCQFRGLFAKWCRPYYEDSGWEIPVLDIPTFRVQAQRYMRPSAEMLERVKNWYGNLSGEHWFAATMMLEFAMRNGDVLRLNDSNFIEKENGKYLSYTPHKTELTSGRRVYWPIHCDIWHKFEEYGRFSGLDVTKETFEDINKDLRGIGFRGSKASYELRKICIDHIYQKYGAEMAVSISGDDIRTITKYYADPTQPNIGAVRVLDLI
jgi:hypothetical protein